MKKMIKVIIVLLALIAAIALLAGWVILSFGKSAKPVRSDCIIVLGCRLYGSVPSPFLKGRLDEGYRLYEEGYSKYIIVSGGKGPGETITEAQAMKAYLEGKGVDSSRILIEDESSSTLENLKYSKAIMDTNSFNSAVIVSNKYHLKRASLMAAKIGIQGSYSGVFLSQHMNNEIKGFIREIAALIFYYAAG